MPIRIAPALSVATLLAGSAAGAQPASAPSPPVAESAPPTAVSGVVVEAPSAKRAKAFAAQVDEFVHDLGQPHAGPIKQIAQWQEAICPETRGLSQDLNDFVTSRVKEIAKRVGATEDNACSTANVLIIFTTEPDKLMTDVREHHSILLGYHFVGETKKLSTFEPPMKSWYVTTTTVVPINKGDSEVAILDQAYAPEPSCIDQRSCRILPALKSRFAFVLVVVASDRIEGKPIGGIADEVAMLALSRPAPHKGCGPLPTVLDLLDSACPSSGSVTGLTPYDEAFLKALYEPHASESLPYERAKIAERIIKETRPPSRDAANPMTGG